MPSRSRGEGVCGGTARAPAERRRLGRCGRGGGNRRRGGAGSSGGEVDAGRGAPHHPDPSGDPPEMGDPLVPKQLAPSPPGREPARPGPTIGFQSTSPCQPKNETAPWGRYPEGGRGVGGAFRPALRAACCGVGSRPCSPDHPPAWDPGNRRTAFTLLQPVPACQSRRAPMRITAKTPRTSGGFGRRRHRLHNLHGSSGKWCRTPYGDHVVEDPRSIEARLPGHSDQNPPHSRFRRNVPYDRGLGKHDGPSGAWNPKGPQEITARWRAFRCWVPVGTVAASMAETVQGRGQTGAMLPLGCTL
jgi:hypothetical protein